MAHKEIPQELLKGYGTYKQLSNALKAYKSPTDAQLKQIGAANFQGILDERVDKEDFMRGLALGTLGGPLNIKEESEVAKYVVIDLTKKYEKDRNMNYVTIPLNNLPKEMHNLVKSYNNAIQREASLKIQGAKSQLRENGLTVSLGIK